jgi:hypothetical protein
MRSATIFTGLAFLSLAASPALAQSYGGSQTSNPPAASTKPDTDHPADTSGAVKDITADLNDGASASAPDQQDKSGYDAKTAKQQEKSKKRATYYQSTGQQDGNESGYLVPFGPPR